LGQRHVSDLKPGLDVESVLGLRDALGLKPEMGLEPERSLRETPDLEPALGEGLMLGNECGLD
jgi:hypothetical protein